MMKRDDVLEDLERQLGLEDEEDVEEDEEELEGIDTMNEVDAMNLILREMVKEIRGLRRMREDIDGDTSKISFTRMDALRKLVDAVVKKRGMIQKGGLDLESPVFTELLRFVMDCLVESMTKLSYGSEDKTMLVNEFSERLESWKRVVRRRTRSSGSDE